MKIISEYIWFKNQREHNEDSLCLCQAEYNGNNILLAAICDGVGGLIDGHKASGIVISNLKKLFFSIPHQHPQSFNSIANQISRCIYSSHSQIASGATTICLVLIFKNQGIVMSCGDTRAYSGHKRLKQITKDHCDSKGRLLQALGDNSFSSIYRKRFRLRKNQSVLICSDGFYRKNHKVIIASDSFFRCKNEEMLKETLEKLHCGAVNNGECDNSSAILIKGE